MHEDIGIISIFANHEFAISRRLSYSCTQKNKDIEKTLFKNSGTAFRKNCSSFPILTMN